MVQALSATGKFAVPRAIEGRTGRLRHLRPPGPAGHSLPDHGAIHVTLNGPFIGSIYVLFAIGLPRSSASSTD